MALEPLRVEHVHQRFGFTCGPAALLMAMRALRPGANMPSMMELWRDATLVASKATSAEGLALSAVRRGFHARVIRTGSGPPFEERIRSQGNDMDLLAASFSETAERARLAGVGFERRRPAGDDVVAAVEGRTPCIVLTDAQRFDPAEPPTPHWVLALRREGDGVAFHDPGLEKGPVVRPVTEIDTLLGFQPDSAIVVIGPGRWP